MIKLLSFLVALLLPFTAFAATFSDVGSDHADYTAIGYFAQEGFVGGYPDGSFQPEKSINRVEALKIILNILGVDATSYDALATKDFPDMQSEDWFYPFVQFAVQRGIVSGTDAGELQPGRIVNQAEFFKLLFEAHGLYTSRRGEVAGVPASAWFAPYVHLADQTRLIADGTIEPGHQLTRGEVVAMGYQFLQRKNVILTQANLNEAEDYVLDALGLLGTQQIDKAVSVATAAVAAAQTAKDRLPTHEATDMAYNIAMAVQHLAIAQTVPFVDQQAHVGQGQSYLNLLRDTSGELSGTAALIEAALAALDA